MKISVISGIKCAIVLFYVCVRVCVCAAKNHTLCPQTK